MKKKNECRAKDLTIEMEKPKYLYHYTNFNSGLSILKTGSFRMYEARNQSDIYEVIYAGHIAFDHIFDIITKEKEQHDKDKLAYLIPILLFISKYFAESEKTKKVQEITMNLPDNNLYRELINIIKEREIKFFISCFSDDIFNKYLWENFATEGEGLVFQFKSDYLPDIVGIKNVIYGEEEIIQYIVKAITLYVEQTEKDNFKFMNELIKNLTHVFLSAKRISYESEKEYRLISSYDSGVTRNLSIFNDGNREFVLLPLTKSQFWKRVNAVYITNRLPLAKHNQLSELLKKKNIEIKRIRYNG